MEAPTERIRQIMVPVAKGLYSTAKEEYDTLREFFIDCPAEYVILETWEECNGTHGAIHLAYNDSIRDVFLTNNGCGLYDYYSNAEGIFCFESIHGTLITVFKTLDAADELYNVDYPVGLGKSFMLHYPDSDGEYIHVENIGFI